MPRLEVHMRSVLWLGLLLPLALAQDNPQDTDSISNPLHDEEVLVVVADIIEIEMTPVQAFPCAEVVEVRQMNRSNPSETESKLECSPRCCCMLACILPVGLCALVMCIIDLDLSDGSIHTIESATDAIDDNHISFEYIEEYSADVEATAEFPQIGSQIN